MKSQSFIKQKYGAGADKLRSAKKKLLECADFLMRDASPDEPLAFSELATYCTTLSDELEMRARTFYKPEEERLLAMKEHGRAVHERNRARHRERDY